MVDGSKVPPREAVEMTRRFAETPVFRRILDEIGMPPGLEGLDEVAVPVTVLWGERDRILPQRLHEPFFRERLPHARFTTLRGAGHVPFWEATGPVVEGIVATTRRAVDVQAASTG
jgi:pimeloyl-ACP methyl ester carboxylesterase